MRPWDPRLGGAILRVTRPQSMGDKCYRIQLLGFLDLLKKPPKNTNIFPKGALVRPTKKSPQANPGFGLSFQRAVRQLEKRLPVDDRMGQDLCPSEAQNFQQSISQNHKRSNENNYSHNETPKTHQNRTQPNQTRNKTSLLRLVSKAQDEAFWIIVAKAWIVEASRRNGDLAMELVEKVLGFWCTYLHPKGAFRRLLNT